MEETGEIWTKEELDREETPEYLLCVQASPLSRQRRDVHALESRSKRATDEELRNLTNHDVVLYVRVIVEDINDNGPQFRDRLIKTGNNIDPFRCGFYPTKIGLHKDSRFPVGKVNN